MQWGEAGESCSVVVFDDGRPRISLYRERVDHVTFLRAPQGFDVLVMSSGDGWVGSLRVFFGDAVKVTDSVLRV